MISVLKYTDKYKEPIETLIENNLTTIQLIVGVADEPAHFETVRLPIRSKRPIIAVMDDEGKLKNLPAVRGLYDDAGCPVDCIRGTFFVCAVKGDDFDSLTKEEKLIVLRYFD